MLMLRLLERDGLEWPDIAARMTEVKGRQQNMHNLKKRYLRLRNKYGMRERRTYKPRRRRCVEARNGPPRAEEAHNRSRVV